MRQFWADVVGLPPKFTQDLTVCHRLNSVPCAKLRNSLPVTLLNRHEQNGYHQSYNIIHEIYPIKLLVKRQSSTSQNSCGMPSSHPGQLAAQLTKLTGYYKLQFAEVSYSDDVLPLFWALLDPELQHGFNRMLIFTYKQQRKSTERNNLFCLSRYLVGVRKRSCTSLSINLWSCLIGCVAFTSI